MTHVKGFGLMIFATLLGAVTPALAQEPESDEPIIFESARTTSAHTSAAQTDADAHAKAQRAQGAKLQKTASKLLFSGEIDEAIAMCQDALALGEHDCHKVMALAYKQKGDTKLACAHFALARTHSPHIAAGITRQMEALKCEPTPR